MHCRDFLRETSAIALSLDDIVIEAMATELSRVKQNDGRVFIIVYVAAT